MIGLLLVTVANSRANEIDEECLACHGAGEDLVEMETHHQVDAEPWFQSIHAEMEISCVDCHEGKEDYPHEEAAEPASCLNCHDDAAEEFSASIHFANIDKPGALWPEGDPCALCHGVHDIKAVEDPDSRVYYRNIPQTCGTCHADVVAIQPQGLNISPTEKYPESVHGITLGNGEENGKRPAVCTNCHGYHRLALASDPTSMINPFNIPTTCGECHEKESEEYLSSSHGQSFMRGVSLSPTCTSCHGIHSIKQVAPMDPNVRAEHLVRSTCPACHSSEALMGEYGATPAKVQTYRASYHGLAQKRGAAAVADCASCHGIHAIYPSTDPRSSVAPENLQATCGGCHPGASEEFSKATVHFVLEDEESTEAVIGMWVTRIYWGLLIVVLGGMLIHNGIILGYYARKRARQEKEAPARSRFSPAQATQHAVLVITFILLVITGFMLAYPDTWWSHLLVRIGITETVRQWVHRICAIGMVAASIHHIIWMWFTPYGRDELRRIAPLLQDFRLFAQNMRFHVGSSKHRPAFGKYDYPAKVEYWSLVWGTIVMAVTGVILWFPVWATSFMPFWVVKVSEIIHLFEAWLATLAILVFHFFYVIAHPEVYPLNFAMFTRTMPEERAQAEHPAWVVRWDKEGPKPTRKKSRKANGKGSPRSAKSAGASRTSV